MMDVNKSLEFWRDNFWGKNLSPWHVNWTHPVLIKYQHYLLVNERPGRILVPLCGKSVDLKYLYEQGHEVFGVECVSEAIEKFFQENNFQFDIISIDGHRAYQTPDKRLSILNVNFFDVKGPTLNNSFDAVWDRAALVAVRAEHRTLYAESIKRLVKDNFRYLLATVEYEQEKMRGPPFSVFEHDVVNLYSSWAAITKLESYKINSGKFVAAGVDICETVYFLNVKAL